MKTAEEIYNEMLELFRRETGVEATAASDLSVRLYAVAAQVYGLYVQTDWLARQCFPQTADGVYLDRHAALRGLVRRPAARAEGVIRFLVDTPSDTDLTILKGTVCTTAGMIRFETVETGTLTAGQRHTDVKARAIEPGAGGNVPADVVRVMTLAPIGISRCINPEPFTGGLEEEQDPELRKRVMETFRRMPNGANAAFYEQLARSFDEVAAASVIPRSRGRGTVDVIVSTAVGQPDEALLTRLAEYFQARREIAVDVQVKGPTLQTVPVNLKVTAMPGVDRTTLKTTVEQELRDFFSGELLSRGVLRAALMNRIFSRDDVENCEVLAPAADVAAAVGVLPVLGTLTVEVV